jgi:hypothetical protein
MLFKVLKLFGLDVPTKIAAAKSELEQRLEEVTSYAKQATQTAALIAALSVVAAFLFIVAAGVGLFALYRMIAEHYGVYAGLGTMAALLIAAASVLLLARGSHSSSDGGSKKLVSRSNSRKLLIDGHPGSESIAPAYPAPRVIR